MIVYRCDRCHAEPPPDKLYDTELVFTPRGLDGGEDTDKEERRWLGQFCADCTDAIESHVQALVQAPAVDAVREDGR